jgi:hypothetical protein
VDSLSRIPEVIVPESLDVTEPRAAPAVSAAEIAPQEPGPEPGASEPALPFANHVEQRTVVLLDQRVLFLPMPKAGCTSVLWLLAELAGIPLDTFAHSVLPEVSPALTVHDMSLWGEGHRLADYEAEERERVLTEEGWLRFTVVRHPGPRLWSAWQSKLLLREPRFVAAFGDQPWFPRMPGQPADLVEDFRRFVAALPSGAVEDVHWGVQHDLAAQLPLTHIGRVERFDDTLAVLREHVSRDLPLPGGGRENRTALPPPPNAYDEVGLAVLDDRYRDDFQQYGYDLVSASEDADATAEWEQRVVTVLPLLRDTIDKHTRIGQLHRMARRAQTLEEKLESATAREVGHSRSPVLTNLEGHTDFNVRWGWSEEVRPGFTAVVRVKNEARPLPWVLPPLLRAVSRVVVIDNGSTDGTAEVARQVAAEAGMADRLDVHSYPFPVARCGEEHLGTPGGSVHSLAYFYNWSFSHVRTSYALKWDGDMVLADGAVGVLRDLAWQLEASEAVIRMPRYPLYVVDERRAFLDLGMANCEAWAWPNRPGYSFVKAMEWEQPVLPPTVQRIVLPDWSCVELKHLDADEFGHWSDTDFDQSERTRRKRREWEVFQTLAEGGEAPSDVVAVEAPDDLNVVDYVRSTWLPMKGKELGGLGERILQRLTA